MNKKILIIEDNDAIRENVVEILEMANYKVYEADNGKIGVETALKHLPDIILCDIMMPQLDGYGVLHMLNKYAETSTIPFIFLTAKVNHSDLRKGMEMGADDYLTKPFDDMELLNAIEIRLRKKAYTELQQQNKTNEFKVLISKTDGLAEFAKLIEGHRNHEVRKNQIIYYESEIGRALYLLIEGRVKTIKLSQDGRELMTGMYAAGDYIGINAVLSNSPHTDTATAMEDCKVCMIPSEEMEKVLNLYPDVARKFIHLLSRDNQDKEEQLLQLAYNSVRKKMAGAILRLYRQQTIKNDHLSISREDLAAMSCIATETVSRTLTDFRDEKLIDRQGTNITILDLEKLSKMKN
ncbi:response regulator [Pedobacter psychroterrae]|uniref:Response regulator n=1 Tax=Pedobacter psychroterrae TaxID=2530453 RepID=A0A4R0NEY2_9SPHI|nr:response regulator [Pedobacter psychroterrae]TCC99011.1 response regulator [Pedobacter psychroterrae]